MVMQLPPNTVRADEPARRAKAKIEAFRGGLASSLLTPDEEMPVVAALAGEIVERDLDAGRPVEQLRVSLANRRPAAPNAADRIVHARRTPVRPNGGEPIEVSGIERPIKINQRVERAAVAGLGFGTGDLGQV